MKSKVNKIIKGRQYDPNNPAVELYYKQGKFMAALQTAMASLKGGENPANEILRMQLKDMYADTDRQRTKTLNDVVVFDEGITKQQAS